jgi:multidrug efflux pump subunit AcrB
MGPPVGKPIALEIASKDYDKAGEFAAKVRRKIGSIAGVTGLEDNYRVGRPELRFRVDRGAAKRVGASTGEIASAVRAAVSGTKASAFRDGDDEYDITVELAPQYKDDLQSILSLRIPGREDMELGTFSVPISSVARYELAGGTGAVNHKAQQPVVTISGDVKEGFNQNAVQEAVLLAVGKMESPPGVKFRLGGANDEQKKSEEFLSTAFLLAIFLIALVLVAQFNRFDLPLIVLASVILSLVGVLWGLILTGTAFGVIMTGLGVISLAGVVVNNAIVLLDYVEQLRREGSPPEEALIQAGLTRFRPVMLTAITTVLGLLPMAVGLSIDFRSGNTYWGTPTSEWWGPMAVAVVFGLAFATVLTLIVVPTFYMLFDDFRRGSAKVSKKLGGLFSTRNAAHPAE